MVKLDITQNLRILRYVDVGQKKGRQIEKLTTHNEEGVLKKMTDTPLLVNV